jgi:hypothetical protein
MSDQSIIRAGQAGGTVSVRQDLGEELTANNELSTTAAAAAAKAEIEARILTAKKWRRDEDQAREDILKRCRHPSAAESFLFSKPVGRKKNAEGQWVEDRIVDVSIRFIEMAIGYWGNVAVMSRITHDDPRKAMLRVDVIDLQRNTGYSTESVQEKVVERREIKKGRTVLGVRENSYGDTVYLVEATKDEFRNVMGSERSKLIRDSGKRLLPRDLIDEARAMIDRTLADENAKDPDAAKKKVLDRFAGLGISALMLKEYLGRPLETLTVKDLNDLAALHNGLKEGDFTWNEVMRIKNEPAEGEGEKPPAAAARGKVRDKIMQQGSFAEPAPASSEPSPDPTSPPNSPTKEK